MKVITTIEEMFAEARSNKERALTVGFVPTMGALHEGHMSLVRRSVEENDLTVISIFLNPTQFDETSDYDNYPKTLEKDLAMAEEAGVDVAFCPDAEDMYSKNARTTVSVSELTDKLCGMSRGRGHFLGVCTVVTKLFNIVQPDQAYFGQKDAQQAMVIQRMVLDLNFPIRILVCPIIREDDGLAMSSRNKRIPEELRESALALREALCLGREKIKAGERKSVDLMSAMAESMICHPEVEVDYIDIVNPDNLEDVDEVDDLVLIAGAVKVGEVRLIDNILVGPDGPWED